MCQKIKKIQAKKKNKNKMEYEIKETDKGNIDLEEKDEDQYDTDPDHDKGLIHDTPPLTIDDETPGCSLNGIKFVIVHAMHLTGLVSLGFMLGSSRARAVELLLELTVLSTSAWSLLHLYVSKKGCQMEWGTRLFIFLYMLAFNSIAVFFFTQKPPPPGVFPVYVIVGSFFLFLLEMIFIMSIWWCKKPESGDSLVRFQTET